MAIMVPLYFLSQIEVPVSVDKDECPVDYLVLTHITLIIWVWICCVEEVLFTFVPVLVCVCFYRSTDCCMWIDLFACGWVCPHTLTDNMGSCFNGVRRK